MHRGVGGDVALLPTGGGTLAVVPVHRRLIVRLRVAEQTPERLESLGEPRHQTVVVVMADLVAEVAEQRAVRLVHRHPQLLPMNVVAFGEVDGDDAVVMTGDHLLGGAGQQVERQTVFGILLPGDHRQMQFAQLSDQPSLGRFGLGERQQSMLIGIRRSGAGQRAGGT